jgi:hypothetical protein
MTKAPYDTTPGNFAYCKTHNRLYIHPICLWLTPAEPEKLQTFQAQCDVCRQASTPLFIHPTLTPAA